MLMSLGAYSAGAESWRPPITTVNPRDEGLGAEPSGVQEQSLWSGIRGAKLP